MGMDFNRRGAGRVTLSLDSGFSVNGNYSDEVRSLSGKTRQQGLLAGLTGATATSLTLSATPPNGVLPRSPILIDRLGTNPEIVYAAAATPLTGAVITLDPNTPTQFSHNASATVEWDAFTALGAGVGPVLPSGVTPQGIAQPNQADLSYYLQRGNNDTGALITAVGATVTQAGADQVNTNGRGLHLVVNITSGAALSLTPHIQGKDVVSGAYYDLLVGAALTGVSTTVLRVYPGLAVAANLVASDILPRTWRVQMVAGNATAANYTISASVIL